MKRCSLFPQIYFVGVLMLMFLISGCSPVPIVKVNGPLTGYKKLYLYTLKDDPKSVNLKVIEGLKSAGFNVKVLEEDEPIESQGSGFVITREGHILTCAHVVLGEKETTVWIKGKRYEADVVAVAKNKDKDKDKNKDKDKDRENENDKDLAIIKVRSAPETSFKPLTFGKDYQYTMGQEVYTMGFPLADMLGNEPRLNRGLISAAVGINDNPNSIQISAEIQPGNSGSPLFDSEKRVIGIITSTINPIKVFNKTRGSLPQNVNFALKLSSIQEFLQKSHVQYATITHAETSLSFESIKESVVQVHSGIVPVERLPDLICTFGYTYNNSKSLESFEIYFYDRKSENVVFGAAYNPYNHYNWSDEKNLKAIFQEIKKNFFPDRKP